MEGTTNAPLEETIRSPLKPMDDSPHAEHTTPPETGNDSRNASKSRGYARKKHGKFSTSTSSPIRHNDGEGNNVISPRSSKTRSIENNTEDLEDAELNMLLDMNSDEDHEGLSKFLEEFEVGDMTSLTQNNNERNGNDSHQQKSLMSSSTSISHTTEIATDLDKKKQKNINNTRLVSPASSTLSVKATVAMNKNNNNISTMVTQKEEMQVEKLFASSSDEDDNEEERDDDNNNSSSSSSSSSSDSSSNDSSSDDSSSSSSEEEDLGNISDAAEDLPPSVTGMKNKRRLAKKKKLKRRRNKNNMNIDTDDDGEVEEEVDPRKPNKSLPFNGLIDEKKFRDILNFAKTSPNFGLSKRKIDKKEKRNLPITSYLVVGKKKGYLPFCDDKFILNEELISNIRKELHKLQKLTPKIRSESNYLQPAPLVPLMLNRANRVFEVLWPGVPGVEFKGGVEGVEFGMRMINLAIKTLNPDLSLEQSQNSISSSRLAINNALNNAIINNINAAKRGSEGDDDEEDSEGHSKVLMTSLVEKLRQRKLSRQSSFTNEVLKAKERGAMEVHRKAKQNIELLKLNVLDSISSTKKKSTKSQFDSKIVEEGVQNSNKNASLNQADDDELVDFEKNNEDVFNLVNKERRRSLSAPITGKVHTIIPTLGSYVSDKNGVNSSDISDSDSDMEIELVDVPNKLLNSRYNNAVKKHDQKSNVKKRKASTRIPSFRRFIRSKSSNGTPKNIVDLKSKGVIDGQNVRKNYFRSLRQVKENARLSQHARLQGYGSFDQWKEAERKEATKKGMDEAQAVLTEAIQRKVFGDRSVNANDLNPGVKSMEVKNRNNNNNNNNSKKKLYTSDMYIPATTFSGPKEGYIFKNDHLGVGYYLDVAFRSYNNNAGSSKSNENVKSALNTGSQVDVASEISINNTNMDGIFVDGVVNKKNPSVSRKNDDTATNFSKGKENATLIEKNFTSAKIRDNSLQDNGNGGNVSSTPMVLDSDVDDGADEEGGEAAQKHDNVQDVKNSSKTKDSKSSNDGIDRAASFRESLLREAEMVKNKSGVNAFVEEEASESEDEDNMGVGEYGVEDMIKRKQNDLMDERMDKMNKNDVLKADLEGIVDAPSDDEGDENADEEGFHADKMREEDDMQVAAVVKNIQEGWARKRQGRRRGRDLDLTEGNKRQKGRLGLDHSDDENDDVDEEAAMAARIERERVRHGEYDFDDISSSEDEGDEDREIEIGPNGEIVKGIKTNPESLPHEFERDHESVEVKRLKRIAKEHKMRAHLASIQKDGELKTATRSNIREGMNINSNSSSNHLVLGRRPSLLVGMDDESSQILGILKRTNTGRRSSSYNNENIMKSGSIVSESTVHDTTSLTVNSGSHTARAVQGMINKSRTNEESQGAFESNNNENNSNKIEDNRNISFSRSNPIFTNTRSGEASTVNMPQQPERPNSRLRRSFSTGSYNQGSFLNANASKQGSSQSNQGGGNHNTNGPTSFGMFNGGNAISRKFVFRRSSGDSSNINDANSRPAWNIEDNNSQSRSGGVNGMNAIHRGNADDGVSNFSNSIFVTDSKNDKDGSRESNLLWDALASNNFKNKK